MILPSITKLQKQIILLLFKFRFLKTDQVQYFLNHKDPRPTQRYLEKLVKYGYIKSLYSRKKRQLNNKPSIFHLKPLSRHILKKEKGMELEQLKFIYKEGTRTKKFIEHSVALADIFIYYLRTKKPDEEIKFYTRSNFSTYSHFPGYPKELPDALLVIQNAQGVKRYFIDLFDEYTLPWVYKKRIKTYINYSKTGNWQLNTKQPLPYLRFICPNETKKMFVWHFGKAKLEKTLENVHLKVATLAQLRFSKRLNNDFLKVA